MGSTLDVGIKQSASLSVLTKDQEPEPVDPRGIWIDLTGASSSSAGPSRAERIRAATLTSRNPLLANQNAIDHRYLRQHGVVTNPEIGQPLQGLIVSLDWHQVLDTSRTKHTTIRTEGQQWYYLLDPVKHHLSEIRRLAERKGATVKTLFFLIRILRHIVTKCWA